MQNKLLTVTFGCAALLLGGCGGSSVNASFIYGNDHPGHGLPEGGEIRFEHVNTPGGPITLAQAYFMEKGDGTWNLPEYGKCAAATNKQSDGKTPLLWPVGDLTNKVYSTDVGMAVTLDNGTKKVVLNKFTGMGLGGNPPTAKKHDIIYGGPMQSGGVAGAIPASDLQLGTTYNISWDGAAAKLTHPSMFLPAGYKISTPQIGVTTATIAANQDLTFQYETLSSPAADTSHPANRVFPFVIFINTDTGLFDYTCLAAAGDNGSQVIPAAVISDVPKKGIVLHGQLTHYEDVFKGRRFDLIAVSCNLSPYVVK